MTLENREYGTACPVSSSVAVSTWGSGAGSGAASAVFASSVWTSLEPSGSASFDPAKSRSMSASVISMPILRLQVIVFYGHAHEWAYLTAILAVCQTSTDFVERLEFGFLGWDVPSAVASLPI